jgi:hypothetical protein
MDAAGSKSRTRKLMRVATTFTGVAACTAGMVQVANAQDFTQAAVKHVGRTARPAVEAAPATPIVRRPLAARATRTVAWPA